MRYATMASGIDAPALAWNPMGWKQLWSSEIEKFPCGVLDYHYPDVPNLGDMNHIHEQEGYSRPDVLMAGTPCQSFSIAGLREGMADPRGNLALVYLGHVNRLRPTWVGWENVTGVFSSWSDETESGDGPRWQTNDFITFVSALRQLGYGVAYRVLDAQYFGLAQRRKRIILIGYLGDWRPAAAVLFEPESMSGYPAPSRKTGEEVAGTLGSGSKSSGTNQSLDGSGAFIPELSAPIAGSDGGPNDMNRLGAMVAYGGNRTSGPLDVSPALLSDGVHQDFDSEAMIVGPLQAGQAGHGHAQTTQQAAESGHLIAFDSKRGGGVGDIAPTLRAMPGDRPNGGGMAAVAQIYSIMPQNSSKDYKARPVDVAQPIMAGGPTGGNQGGDYLQQGATVRRLTPIECERLMGMPDNYTRIPWRGKPAEQCPDGPRYRAIGNSIAVPLLSWLGRRIEMVDEIINIT